MRTGNVIRTPYNSIVIVTSVNDNYVNWVSFDHENSSGGGKIEDSTSETLCGSCNYDSDSYDPDCEDCKGNGSYPVKVLGYKRSIVLASCVKEYILNALKKNFDF